MTRKRLKKEVFKLLSLIIVLFILLPEYICADEIGMEGKGKIGSFVIDFCDRVLNKKDVTYIISKDTNVLMRPYFENPLWVVKCDNNKFQLVLYDDGKSINIYSFSSNRELDMNRESNLQVITEDRGFESLKKLLQFLKFPTDKSLYKVSYNENEMCYKYRRIFYYNGIPNRTARFDAFISGINGELEYFMYIPGIIPSDSQIPNPIPQDDLYLIAKEYLKNNSFFSKRQHKICYEIKPKIVLGYDLDIDTILDAKKHKKVKKFNSLFCWEVVFEYGDNYMKKDLCGVLWIDSRSKKVIGCGLWFTKEELKLEN